MTSNMTCLQTQKIGLDRPYFSAKVIYCKPDPTKISQQQMFVFLFRRSSAHVFIFI